MFKVDAKPDNFKERTDIYIDGYINRAWINQKFPSSAISFYRKYYHIYLHEILLLVLYTFPISSLTRI